MHVILDFDGTITVNDTVDQLANFAVAFQQAQDAQVQSARSIDDDNGDNSDNGGWEARWTGIVDKYLADHKEHKAGYAPTEDARTTLDHELAFLRSLHGVDCKSIYRLREARLFAGMAPDCLYEGGRQAVERGEDGGNQDKKHTVHLRPGFAAFLKQMSAQRKWPVSIVSVNWSDSWIRGVLRADDNDNNNKSEDAAGIRVFANKVTESGAIIPNFPRQDAPANHDHDHDDNVPFASCSDKVEALEAAVAAATKSRPEQSAAVVYMGDSTTDLECLVHAGKNRNGGGGGGGIAMANGDGPATSKLIQTLVRLGYTVPHVSEAERFQRPRSDDEGNAPRLAWARDYDEIMASQILD
ncbi:hypothetical protein SCUCBS95973_002156 [Sporothrix curviconia]|uniref:Haloacid dehalogenase-like hydrolase n=1 Tax=Sporothrix curviconia TaxID=1260050 RepID=A0ABP0B4I2_9PEZI